jgi:hypothetical protein
MGITTLTSAALDSMEIISGKIVEVFSISGVIYANAVSDQGLRLKIKGDFTIRYNRRFQNTPLAGALPVNHNPTQRWIGVYKVQGKDVKSFQPGDPQFAGKFSLSYLQNARYPDSVNDTVFIDTGYTFFLGADSGVVTYVLKAGDTMTIADSLHVFANDTTIHDTALDRNAFDFETWYYDWQYENLDLDSVTKPLDSLFIIAGGGEGGGQPPIVQMLPSLDTRLTHVRIWVTVYDELLGELNRPVGFAIKNVDVYFKYTDAYKKTHL